MKFTITNLIILLFIIACNEVKAENIDNYIGKLFCYIGTNNSRNTNYYYVTTYTRTKTKENIILNYGYMYGSGVGHIDTLVTNMNNIYYYMSYGSYNDLYYKAISFNKNKMEVINYALFILTVAMLIITVIQYYKQILKNNKFF